MEHNRDWNCLWLNTRPTRSGHMVKCEVKSGVCDIKRALWRITSGESTIIQPRWHLVGCCELSSRKVLSWIEFICWAPSNYLTERQASDGEKKGERERRTVLIGYLAPLDVDWTMALHHYNLSSGSNLNPECPLPTALDALESAGSLLKSYFIYFYR